MLRQTTKAGRTVKFQMELCGSEQLVEESISLLEFFKCQQVTAGIFYREHATTAGFLLFAICYVKNQKNLLQPVVGFLSNFFTVGLGIQIILCYILLHSKPRPSSIDVRQQLIST